MYVGDNGGCGFPDQDLPTFPMDTSYLRGLRDRVVLAKRIERVEHSTKRVQQGNKWFIQQAKAMDIELDQDLYPKCTRLTTYCRDNMWEVET